MGVKFDIVGFLVYNNLQHDILGHNESNLLQTKQNQALQRFNKTFLSH
mgnify:CR=1 FL=1